MRLDILGQSLPAAATDTPLFISNSPTIVKTISICNTAVTASTFSIAVVPAGKILSAKNYLYFNSAITAGKSIQVNTTITMNAGDRIIVSSGTDALAYSCFGAQGLGVTFTSIPPLPTPVGNVTIP